MSCPRWKLQAGLGPLWTVAAFVVLLLGATLPRLNHLSRPLWTAEAWVANSVLAPKLAGMFYYDAWLQTSPPLFLLLVRASVGAFGASNFTLRLVPFALGMLSLVLLALLSKRMFRTPLALFCTALAALSPTAVLFSKDMKQYSGDMASTVLILFVSWIYLHRASRRNFYWLLASCALALLLSYTSPMVIPVALFAVLAAGPEHGGSMIGRCVALASLVLLIGGAEYLLFIRPNAGAQLSEFWKPGFPDWSSPRGVVVFYCKYFLGLGICFFLTSTSVSAIQDFFTTNPGIAMPFSIAIAGLVLTILIRRFRREQRYAHIAVFSFAPLVALAVLNAVHRYPVDARRLTLFTLPCVAIAITMLLGIMCDTPVEEGAVGRWLLVPLGVLSVAAVLWSGFFNSWVPEQEEDVEAALNYLKMTSTSGDLIYVHASVIEPVKLYLKLLNWPDAPVMFGDSGFPCCPRDPRNTTTKNTDAAARRELDTLLKLHPAGKLWLLFTTRSEHWVDLHRNDETLFVRAFQDHGWRTESIAIAPEAVVHKLALTPLSLAPTTSRRPPNNNIVVPRP